MHWSFEPFTGPVRSHYNSQESGDSSSYQQQAAVFYLNKQGGARSTSGSRHNKNTLNFCINNIILLNAFHLLGVINSIEDSLSRYFIDHDEQSVKEILQGIFLFVRIPGSRLLCNYSEQHMPKVLSQPLLHNRCFASLVE